MSLGGGISAALDTAVNNLSNSGVTIAVAAGNSNANACNSSPARAANAITTGSTTSTDARSSFSNFGTCVDIFAPGSSILSSYFTSDTATATLSGTSMASPHVAGVAALYKQANPSASATTIRNAIVNNADHERDHRMSERARRTGCCIHCSSDVWFATVGSISMPLTVVPTRIPGLVPCNQSHPVTSSTTAPIDSPTS